jgi:hypothetical protein
LRTTAGATGPTPWLGAQLSLHRLNAAISASAATALLFVHLSSLVERRSRASSFEKAEVELEHDQLELRSRIAWPSERLATGAALTAQIRP